MVSDVLHVYTIGHSTHRAADVVDRLRRHGVSAIADVRSVPYSRYNPEFNRDEFAADVRSNSFAYVYLGETLGGRSPRLSDYDSAGRVQYDLLAQSVAFASGIQRLVDGATKYKVAIMCSEADPLQCHRGLLIAPELTRRGIVVDHILADGHIECHAEAMDRLLAALRISELTLFASREDLIAAAIKQQASKVAYVDQSLSDRMGAGA
jgi:uncharacterized protein (DUF488 family)